MGTQDMDDVLDQMSDATHQEPYEANHTEADPNAAGQAKEACEAKGADHKGWRLVFEVCVLPFRILCELVVNICVNYVQL